MGPQQTVKKTRHKSNGSTTNCQENTPQEQWVDNQLSRKHATRAILSPGLNILPNVVIRGGYSI